jgi:raffinose/stachyose/melibiose transport system substrate-binding protein
LFYNYITLLKTLLGGSKMKANPKRLVATISFLVMMLGLLLTGCSDSPTNSKSESDDGSSATEDQVTLEFWYRWPESQKAVEETIAAFEKENPNIKIQMQTSSGNQYTAQLQTAITGGDLPDIFPGSGAVPMHQLHSLGILHPLDDIIGDRRDEFYEGTWTEGFTTMDGKIYTLPHFTPRRFATVMYYNKDVFEKAGLTEDDVPKSWSELTEISETIYEKTNGESYGLIIGLKTNWLMERLVSTMSSAIKPEVVPNDGFNLQTGQYEFNSPGVVQTMEFLKQLQDEKQLHPNSLVIDYREASTMFAGGKAAFVIDGTFLSAELQNKNNFQNFGVAPLPTKDGAPQYWAFQGETSAPIHVNKNTEHYEEVKLFLNFFMDDFYKRLVEQGIESSPIVEHNETIEVDNEGFTQGQSVQDDTFILTPHPYSENINTINVATEMAGKEPKEDLGILLEGYLAGQIPDIETALTEVTNGYNEAFENALKKIQSDGAEVDKEDYTFPDWTPLEPYQQGK